MCGSATFRIEKSTASVKLAVSSTTSAKRSRLLRRAGATTALVVAGIGVLQRCGRVRTSRWRRSHPPARPRSFVPFAGSGTALQTEPELIPCPVPRPRPANSGSSCAPAETPSRLSRPGSAATGCAASPVCVERRSRNSPACRSPTTPALSKASPAERRTRSSTPSPEPSSSVTTNASTCSNWPDLAPSANSARPAPGGQALVDAMTGVSAVLLGRRNDVLAWNPLGHALFAGHLPFDAPQALDARPNLTRMLFLDPHTRELYPNWNDEAALLVASLRFVAAQYPEDRALAELVGELSVKSTEFAGLWAKHTVQLCSRGTKHLHHPEIGDLDLDYQALHLPDTDGQRLVIHTAARGSSSSHALSLLMRIHDGQEANGDGMARPPVGLDQRRETRTAPAGGAEPVRHVAQGGGSGPLGVEQIDAHMTNRPG